MNVVNVLLDIWFVLGLDWGIEGVAVATVIAEVSALITEKAFDWLDAPVKRVSGKDVPMPYAANLEKLALPQVEDIVSACTQACYED